MYLFCNDFLKESKINYHPERPGELLATRLLAVDPDAKPRHFGDVILTRETTFTYCLFSN
jgi:hypothetical protein